MNGSTDLPGTIRFGVFEFVPQSGELRKQGAKIKLQGQPVEILAMLLAHPGEVVMREDLQKKLWPADTFVDFEHSLNAAIKRLRAALGDSAETPRYVETLARRGYRFIAPVDGHAQAPPEAPGTVTAKPIAWRRYVWLSVPLAAVALAVGLNVGGVRDLVRGRSTSSPIRSLAVLPLDNLSRDPEQDYFADGMTDALIDQLSKISALRVISRTSVMLYKGTKKRLPEMAHDLNVDAVVEGTVLRSGDRVRITAQLIHAATDEHLWGQSYERDLRDVLALQSDVARAIADEVRVKVTPREQARLASVHATNQEAYLAYMKGRFYWNKRTEEGVKKGIEYFEHAIQKDPGYALAYDGLADSWLPQAWYGYLAPQEVFPRAKAAATRALELDDSLAEAHATLAFINLYYDRNWTAAEREFHRAIELNTNYANAHHWYADYLSLIGRHSQAIAESERARALDPLSSIINCWLGWRYYFAGEYDKAIEKYRNTLEMDPEFVPGRWVLGQAYEQKGMLREAVAELERAVNLSGGSPVFRASLARAYAVSGRKTQALKLVDDLNELRKQRYVSSYDMALAVSGFADRHQTLAWLQRAVEERSPRALFLKVEPRLSDLRSDPGFQDLVRHVGLPQ